MGLVAVAAAVGAALSAGCGDAPDPGAARPPARSVALPARAGARREVVTLSEVAREARAVVRPVTAVRPTPSVPVGAAPIRVAAPAIAIVPPAPPVVVAVEVTRPDVPAVPAPSSPGDAGTGVAPAAGTAPADAAGPADGVLRPAALPTVPGSGGAGDTCVVAPSGRIGDVLRGVPPLPTGRVGDGRERDGGRLGGFGGLGGGRRPF